MIETIPIKKIMIDTAPFIYYIEEHEKYFPLIKSIFDKIDEFEIDAVTSTITLLEVLVQPIKENDKELEKQYLEILIDNENLELIDINVVIAKKASEIRANYKIKTPDAIQLASGIVNQCDSFLTNDKDLKKVKEINVIVLDDHKKNETL